MYPYSRSVLPDDPTARMQYVMAQMGQRPQNSPYAPGGSVSQTTGLPGQNNGMNNLMNMGSLALKADQAGLFGNGQNAFIKNTIDPILAGPNIQAEIAADAAMNTGLGLSQGGGQVFSGLNTGVPAGLDAQGAALYAKEFGAIPEGVNALGGAPVLDATGTFTGTPGMLTSPGISQYVSVAPAADVAGSAAVTEAALTPAYLESLMLPEAVAGTEAATGGSLISGLSALGPWALGAGALFGVGSLLDWW